MGSLVKGLDFPVVDFLQTLSPVASAGINFVCDPRGIPRPVDAKRYGYIVLPLTATTWMVLALDLETGSVMPMALPPAAPGGTYLTNIMASFFDPNGPANTPTLYVIVACSAAPWMAFLALTINTNVWLARAAIGGLAAPLGNAAGVTPNDIHLMHPCTSLGIFANPAIAEDFIYADGDGGVFGGAGISNIARYSKAGNAWVLLTGAGGVRGGAPDVGSKLLWLPNDPDVFYSNRGGNSPLVDFYTPATDAWAAGAAMVPATILGEGTDIATLYEAPGRAVIRPSGGGGSQIWVWNPRDGTFETLCKINGADGTAHRGNCMCAWFVSGTYFLGVIPHGKGEVQRIELVLPV